MDLYWWGFSEAHGWVVLDRTIPCNQPGRGDDLLFFRCRDLKNFRCSRNDWNPPLYVFAPNYLRGLPDAATQEFESVKAEIQPQLPAIADALEKVALEKMRQRAIDNHQHFLESRGIPYLGISETGPNKGRRVTHCYSCKDALDNAINSECAACRWIICNCGACGCGYEHRTY